MMNIIIMMMVYAAQIRAHTEPTVASPLALAHEGRICVFFVREIRCRLSSLSILKTKIRAIERGGETTK